MVVALPAAGVWVAQSGVGVLVVFGKPEASLLLAVQEVEEGSALPQASQTALEVQ